MKILKTIQIHLNGSQFLNRQFPQFKSLHNDYKDIDGAKFIDLEKQSNQYKNFRWHNYPQSQNDAKNYYYFTLKNSKLDLIILK